MGSDVTRDVQGPLAGMLGCVLHPGSSPWALLAEAGQAAAAERGLHKSLLSLPTQLPHVLKFSPCTGITAEHHVQHQSRNVQGEHERVWQAV